MADVVEEIEEAKEKVEETPEAEELKEKYGVMATIPSKVIEEEEIEKEEKKKKEEKKEETIPELLLRIEKVDSKLELMNNFRVTTEERMTDMSEKIGELRSSLLSLEKRFTSIETGTESVLEMVKEISPASIKKDIGRKDQEILELRAEIEKHGEMLESLRRQGKEISTILNQIGNIENILRISRTIGDKLAALDETRVYVERTSTKIEAIFSELSEKLKDVEAQKEKVKKLNELNVDMAKTLDELSIKVSKLGPSEGLSGELIQKVNKLEENLNKVVLAANSLINELNKTNKRADTYFKFLQTLNMLLSLSDKIKIQTTLNELNNVIASMKQLNVWDEDTKHQVVDILRGLSSSWKSAAGYDIAKVLEEESFKHEVETLS
jgi:DNA repair exonuclease SbcCD ATPase subunit